MQSNSLNNSNRAHRLVRLSFICIINWPYNLYINRIIITITASFELITLKTNILKVMFLECYDAQVT